MAAPSPSVAPGQTRSRVVHGSPRTAGREAAQALLEGRAVRFDPPIPKWARALRERLGPGPHPVLGAGIVAASLAAFVALAVLVHPNVFVLGLVAGPGWFIAIVGAFSIAWYKTRDPHDSPPSPQLGAMFAIGNAGGVGFVALAFALANAALASRLEWAWFVLAGAILGAALGWAALHVKGVSTSLLTTVGMVATVVSGYFLPRFFAIMALALGLVTVGFAWSGKKRT